MSNQYSGELTAAIMAAAASQHGLNTSQVPGYTANQVGQIACKLVRAGVLFRAKISHSVVRYFTTQEAAEFHQTRNVRPRGDRQLRVDDKFDRARNVNESAAKLRNSNKPKAEPVIPAGLVPTKCPDALTVSRYAPTEGDASWKLFSACVPGEYPMPAGSCAARAAKGVA